MAKRSPILGYNHNIRYRGLVFHVQTEDSGLLNPHLFTHLFYEGVIVSTRKLVYDAGADEEAIKALMQAQHKAVMKDLRRGAFDDKIDQYLGDKPGLEPRTSPVAPKPISGATTTPTPPSSTASTASTAPSAPSVPSVPSAAPSAAAPVSTPTTAAPAAASAPAPSANDSGAAPLEIVHDGLSEPIELPVKSRTDSGDRTVPVSAPPTPSDSAPPPAAQEAAPTKSRTTTAQRGSGPTTDIARAPTQRAPSLELRESSPVIEISVDDDEYDYIERSRSPRDTAVEVPVEDPSAPHNVETAVTTPHRQARPPSHGAATLPARPPSRPIAPPVVTRPGTQERKRPDSDVVEVYSPPPPSAEPPPGERAERPGQYLMSRKEGAAIREQTGKIPPTTPARTRPPGSGQNPPPGSAQRPVPPTRGTQPLRPTTPAAGTRVPTPATRVTAPISTRAQSPSGSGVVMTRPAVIVGAPPKPPVPRVRKAREDEGRGFGQGLISEKSLDEVILAYLSEDAEDK